MVSHETGMRPDSVTIINPWKDIGQAKDRTSSPLFSRATTMKGLVISKIKVRLKNTTEEEYIIKITPLTMYDNLCPFVPICRRMFLDSR